MCYRIGVTGDRIFNLRGLNWIVVERSFTLHEFAGSTFFAPDLDLDPMTFIHELDPYSVEIHRLCKYELPMLSLSKVIV